VTEQQPEWTVRVVAAVIVRDGRILLTQRSPKRDYPWWWECPGGKIEPDEQPFNALLRELGEEIDGVRGRLATLPFFRTVLHLERTVEISFHLARPYADAWQPRLLDVQGAAWFHVHDMRELVEARKLVPGNVRLLDYLLAHHSSDLHTLVETLPLPKRS
jgi:8-oxo-dGTP diphosphatase